MSADEKEDIKDYDSYHRVVVFTKTSTHKLDCVIEIDEPKGGDGVLIFKYISNGDLIERTYIASAIVCWETQKVAQTEDWKS